MANIKFSSFTTETNPANVDFLVGYEGTTMKKIDPTNIGGGASSLNGLSDVLIDTASEYVGTVPAGLSGNPQGNTTLGIDAGNAITNGAQNTVIGNDAMKFQTARSEYAVVGYQAGFNCTGNSVTALGWQAAYAGNQDGSVSIGTSAHGTGFAANDAVAVGSLAAYTGTATGSVAIGKRAGYNGNDKTNSVLIGFDAGRSASSTGHISIGYQAGYTNTSGSENTNIGYQTGYTNSTSGSNTNVGHQAAYYATGQQLAAFGYRALFGSSGASSGSYNSAFGREAGVAVTSGSQNTLLGAAAGKAITTGANNTVIGSFAAFNSLIDGDNNIVIGKSAAPSATGVDNEITLGDANITALRIPGLQSGASDGDVLTFASGTGLITLQAAGGGGASSLNGLSDVLIDTASEYVGTVPSGLSGNPQGNTTLGIEAGLNLTSGGGNSLVGDDAGKTITTGARNVALGQISMSAAATGINDTVAVGYSSGSQATGSSSVHVGRFAAYTNQATAHVSIGQQAGLSQTSGASNTNVGYQAGYSNTTGGFRTMLGYEAGKSNTGGSNTFIGKGAGKASGAGIMNVVVGSNAMAFGALGNFNVGIGHQAAQSSTAANNTIIGYQAGQYNTSGGNNTFLGFEAARNTTTGGNNTVLGYQAMDANTDGDDNVAIGANALGAATSDGRTVAIGVNALKLQNQTFNPQNTAVGYAADDANVSGFGRTCIGASTGGGATGDNITNIGYQANPSSSSVSNEITLGNSSVAALRCAVTTITSLSDQRDKTDIKDISYGLDFIDNLQPREFVWDNRAETDKDGEEFYSANKGKKDFGFIAQEVQSVDDDTLRLVYDENPDKLELSYGKLVPILVQAIKELKAEVELLKNK